MTRHPSVPADQTGWIPLGTATTDTAMLAFVDPAFAGLLGDLWASRYLDEDGDPLPRDNDAPEPEHEIIEFEEMDLGDEGDQAVLISTHSDGGWIVEGRLGDMYGEGRMVLMEVRVRVWYCGCSCHEDSDEPPACTGDCHDEDPAA